VIILLNGTSSAGKTTLAKALQDALPTPYLVIGIDTGPDAWASDASRYVAVNREFLLQAVDAPGSAQLVLELDGPIKPLALRDPNDEYSFSMLMPIRR
jgi:chloramphenicol 3-O-phosphotransferase